MALKDWFTHCQKTTAGTVLQRKGTRKVPECHQGCLTCACGQVWQKDSQDTLNTLCPDVSQGKLRHCSKAMSQQQSWNMAPGVLAAMELWGAQEQA